jgi:hypothetical protein
LTIAMVTILIIQQYSVAAPTVLKVEPSKNIPNVISGNNVYMVN